MEGEGGVYSATPGRASRVDSCPQFVLESHDRTAGRQARAKAYLDRVIPAAVAAISQRETPGRNAAQQRRDAEQPIPVSDGRIDRGVWGVATWTDIDPRIDFFSVYVGGLTNAYRWEDTPGAYRPGDPPGRGRQFRPQDAAAQFLAAGRRAAAERARNSLRRAARTSPTCTASATGLPTAGSTARIDGLQVATAAVSRQRSISTVDRIRAV